jgi:hypothetical protein
VVEDQGGTREAERIAGDNLQKGRRNIEKG